MYHITLTGIHESWLDIIEPLWKKHGVVINNHLEKETAIIFPEVDDVFRVFKITPKDHVRVCILGMDPYINQGEAHGLAFSIKTSKRCPQSLNNIFKELAREYPEFPKRTNKDLTDWAQQGVLLLNTALTVRQGSSGSHLSIWKRFMTELFTAIAASLEGVVYILWGNHAQQFEHLIDTETNLILKHSHPSPLSRKPFVGNGHFKKCNDFLVSRNKQAIMWVCCKDKYIEVEAA